jgi:YXWGXW repeat-containing protein
MKAKILGGAFVLLTTLLTACGGGYRYDYARYGPPPPRYRIVGVAPGPGYVWTDGRWRYKGNRYVWEDGRWVRPPRGHSRWERGDWQRDGNRWRYRDGRWR